MVNPGAMATASMAPGSNTEETSIDGVAAAVVRFRTGIAGRKGRGRAYIAGIRNGEYHRGNLLQEHIDAWNARFVIIMGDTGWGSSPYIPCVGARDAPFGFTPITSMQVSGTRGHQRRRGIGVGI